MGCGTEPPRYERGAAGWHAPAQVVFSRQPNAVVKDSAVNELHAPSPPPISLSIPSILIWPSMISCLVVGLLIPRIGRYLVIDPSKLMNAMTSSIWRTSA